MIDPETLHPLEISVLGAIRPSAPLTEEELERGTLLGRSQLQTAIGWLLTKRLVAEVAEERRIEVSLTDAGEAAARGGTLEMRILADLDAGRSVSIEQLRTEFEPSDVSSAVGALKESRAIKVGEGGKLIFGEPTGRVPFERSEALLKRVAGAKVLLLSEILEEDHAIVLERSRKRGKAKGLFRVDERVVRSYRLTEEGGEVARAITTRQGGEEVGQLTPALLKEGGWREKKFRRYNIALNPRRILAGRKHPYREFLDFVKGRFLEMGFVEMRGPLVESEFWNMDVLFMPQSHPSRDIHDVYYVKGSLAAEEPSEEMVRKVAAVHESGGEGTRSRGWGYRFDRTRTRRLILRSQGTAVSARTLAANPAVPGKYFSIARCFRYDAVDATHAADFFQVEGIVLGEEIDFRMLLGLLQLFAREIARAKEIRFVPAYFPFTEPSVELHVRHPDLGWMELGGAGLFRPEVTIPLGVGVPVIAWGLGLDRMAMVALGISDIRDLFSSDLDFIRSKVFAL